MPDKALKNSGRATVEYAIIMPLAIACVVAAITVFQCLYQKSAIQTLAEQAAESLSMVWGHGIISEEDITTGAYSRESYDNRQLYWQVFPSGTDVKTGAAQNWAERQLERTGLLEEIKSRDASVTVRYQHGFPASRITVSITAYYRMPGAAALKYLGLGDILVIRGYAEAPVYDQKEMINVADYIIQAVMESRAGELIRKLGSTLKRTLEMMD